MDSLHISPAAYGQVDGFTNIPWQIKALWGLLSDTVPINGYHRRPYILFAGCIGVVAVLLLAMSSSIDVTMAALLLLFANLSMAMPDVMIDATVAERAKLRPDLAAEMQALCWGSLGLIGLFGTTAAGYLVELGGPRLLFTLAIGSCACAAVPALMGWVGDKQGPHRRIGPAAKELCGAIMSEATKRSVALASVLVAGTRVLT